MCVCVCVCVCVRACVRACVRVESFQQHILGFRYNIPSGFSLVYINLRFAGHAAFSRDLTIPQLVRASELPVCDNGHAEAWQ